MWWLLNLFCKSLSPYWTLLLLVLLCGNTFLTSQENSISPKRIVSLNQLESTCTFGCLHHKIEMNDTGLFSVFLKHCQVYYIPHQLMKNPQKIDPWYNFYKDQSITYFLFISLNNCEIYIHALFTSLNNCEICIHAFLIDSVALL